MASVKHHDTKASHKRKSPCCSSTQTSRNAGREADGVPHQTNHGLSARCGQGPVDRILIGYRVRREIKIFHKMIKMLQGFEDVAAKSFRSVVSHVQRVYCAYILLNSNLPGVPASVASIAEKRGFIEPATGKRKESYCLHVLSRINGADQLKSALRKVLDGPSKPQTIALQGF